MQRTFRVTNHAGMLILLGIGALLLCIALFVTPEVFISLGPLRRSLTSDNEIVRSTAFLEVAFVRGLCGLAGLVALIIAVFRKRLMSSRLWRHLTNHEPELSGVRDFGVTNYSLVLIVLLAVTGIVFIFLAPERLAPEVIDMIVQEDGLVEYISALLFLFSSIMAIVLLIRYQMPSRHRVMLVFLAFCLFVFFGEEISWGQRIFGIGTLEILREANVQNENNLHNLFGYLFPSLFLLAVIVYGVVFPFVAGISRTMQQMFDLMGLMIASRGLAIGFLMAVLFRDWTFEKFVTGASFVPSAEIGEMLISVGFFLLMLEIAKSLADLQERNISSNPT